MCGTCSGSYQCAHAHTIARPSPPKNATGRRDVTVVCKFLAQAKCLSYALLLLILYLEWGESFTRHSTTPLFLWPPHCDCARGLHLIFKYYFCCSAQPTAAALGRPQQHRNPLESRSNQLQRTKFTRTHTQNMS